MMRRGKSADGTVWIIPMLDWLGYLKYLRHTV